MSSSFDPYHVWLGISPKDQPPNRYRLLGVDLFESDPQVIESAADRQMAHIRTFQAGQHGALSQRLLNEIAAARITLLSAERKAAYDAALKAQIDAATPPSAIQPPPRKQTAGAPAPPRQSGSKARSLPADRAGAAPLGDAPEGQAEQRPRPFWRNPLVLGGAAVCLVIVVFACWLIFGGRSGEMPVAGGRAAEPTPRPDAQPAARSQPAEQPTPTQSGAQSDPGGTTPPRDASPPQGTQEGGPKPIPPPKTPASWPKPQLAADANPLPADAKLGQPIDLLALIDPKRDAVQGQWTFDGQTLMSPLEPAARIQIPHSPPAEYVLTMVAQRKSGEESLDVGLVVGGRQTVVVLDGSKGTVSGLELIDGKRPDDNETMRWGPLLDGVKPYTIVCTVLDKRVHVACDGQVVIDWRGDPQRLSIAAHWQVPDAGKLFLGADESAFHVSKLELVPLLGEPPAEAGPATVPTSTPGPSPQTNAAEPVPVPPPADQATAEKQVRELFKAEYAEATSPEAKLLLAETLLSQAAESQDDPAAHYVMLTETSRLAIEAGEVAVALDTIGTLAEGYEVDVWTLRSESISQLASTARTPEARRELARQALELADPAAADDRYEVADDLVAVALAAATKARAVELRNDARQHRDELRTLKKAWEACRPALETLAADPDDPDASLHVGKFYCFTKRDWKRGLPHLARGSDPALKAIAEADLAEPAEPIEQTKLGDRWWQLAGSLSADEKPSARWRAGHWYLRAEPQLAGLQRARIEKHLKECGRIIDLLGRIEPKKVAYVGNWQSDGKVLVSPPDQFARFQLDYAPPDAYELTVVVERMPGYLPAPGVIGHGALVLGLSSGDSQFLAGLDWHRWGLGYHALLLLFDGEVEVKNPTRRLFRQVGIQAGKAATVVCTVSSQRVVATLDGETVIDWSGDLKRLSLPQEWAVPDPKRLFVGSHACSFRITKLEVRLLEE